MKPLTDSLGQLIQNEMKQQGFTIHSLAKAAGTGVGSIQNLLRQGDDTASSGVHPLVLRYVCEVLHLDQLSVFSAAGYINQAYSSPSLSADAHRIGLLYDTLPRDQQIILQGIVQGLAQGAGIQNRGKRFQDIIDMVEHLREQHPMFAERPFVGRRQIGLRLGRLTRTTTHMLLLKNILERVNGSFLSSDTPITAQTVEDVTSHRDVAITLNALLPIKEIPSPLEKLYWLIHDEGTAGTPISDLPQSYHSGIRALWLMLSSLAK